MKLRKSLAVAASGFILAGMIAGAGGFSAMAAESTTSDYAVEVALNDAGLSEDDVTIEDVEKGNEQGASVYEVEFWTDSAEYEYDIAIADGEIVSVSRELTDPSLEGKEISKAEAKKIALKHAGVNENKASFSKNQNGTENGISVFEFKFEDSEAEYKYDVAKQGGEILSYTRTIKTPACVGAAGKANK